MQNKIKFALDFLKDRLLRGHKESLNRRNRRRRARKKALIGVVREYEETFWIHSVLLHPGRDKRSD